MDDVTKRLDHLGRAVSEVAERIAAPAAIELSRRRFLSAAPPRRRGRSRTIGALAFAACFSLVALLVGRQAARPSPVSFQVGAAGERGAVGAWIAATGGEALPLRFSEGTTVVLAPRTQVRVTETSTQGAGLLIEQGQVEASVVHVGQDTRWMVAAGPYQVRVTGTRFRAAWSPSTETFELSMVEGSVVVTGPLLPNGRVCQAGERLRASTRDGRLEVRTARAEGVETPTELVEAARAPGPFVPSLEGASVLPAAPPGASNRAPGSPSEPAWRALFAAGKYKEAFVAVERVGFAAEIERASTGDLLALADVARYGGRPADARAALLAARARGSRGRSAFLLGKVAADQQGLLSIAAIRRNLPLEASAEKWPQAPASRR